MNTRDHQQNRARLQTGNHRNRQNCVLICALYGNGDVVLARLCHCRFQIGNDITAKRKTGAGTKQKCE
jgi:hypothetical protein